MLLVKQILNKLPETYKQNYTVVKFNVSNSCCTSQDDNNFIMSLKQFTYDDFIEYLLKECQEHFPFDIDLDEELDVDLDDFVESLDEDDDKELDEDLIDELNKKSLFIILCQAIEDILENKRLSIYDCECGLDFFIFNEKDKIVIDNSDFNNSKYHLESYFNF